LNRSRATDQGRKLVLWLDGVAKKAKAVISSADKILEFTV